MPYNLPWFPLTVLQVNSLCLRTLWFTLMHLLILFQWIPLLSLSLICYTITVYEWFLFISHIKPYNTFIYSLQLHITLFLLCYIFMAWYLKLYQPHRWETLFLYWSMKPGLNLIWQHLNIFQYAFTNIRPVILSQNLLNKTLENIVHFLSYLPPVVD